MVRGAVGLLLVMSLGCHRASAPAPAATDYRKMTPAELVAFIGQKLHNDGITLAADGPNHYQGKIKSPDGTTDLPLDVTVETERIIGRTKTAVGEDGWIITPQGLQSLPLKMR
jgi:hypothetical protein